MNGLWRYMLEEINKPAPLPTLEEGKVHDVLLKEANEDKIIRWLTITESLRGVIRSTCIKKPMSHINDMDLCSNIWTKFETLYWDTEFIERDTILIRLSPWTFSDFSNVAQFAESLKCHCKCSKRTGTKDVLDWIFTIWVLHGLDSEYDFFRIMLNNSRKAEQANRVKSEPGFDFILRQILNLDTQRKSLVARPMKSSLQPKNRKKNIEDLCLYCSKPVYIKEIYYYKYPERASQNFQERFKDRIKELQSKAHATRSHIEFEVNIDHVSEPHLSENQGLIALNKRRILATGGNDKSWYFDNAASYHMTFDLADF